MRFDFCSRAAALALSVAPLTAPAQSPPAEPPLTPRQEALVAYKSGRLDDALAKVGALLARQPNDAALLLLKGRVLLKLANYPEAENCLLAADREDAALPEVRYYLGEAAFRQGRWHEALQAYRAQLEKTPGHRDTQLKLVYSHLIVNDLPAAAQLITGLDPADDQSPVYYFARAALSGATGKAAVQQELLHQVRTIYGNEMYNQYEPDLLFTLKKLAERAANHGALKKTLPFTPPDS